MTLVAIGEFDAAKPTSSTASTRQAPQPGPGDIQALFEDSAHYFPTPLQQFQFFDKYSRFNWDLMRRETWVETVGASWTTSRLAGPRRAWPLPSQVWDASSTR